MPEELLNVHAFFASSPVLSADWFAMVHTQETLGMRGVFKTFSQAVLFGKYLQWIESHTEEFSRV